MQDLSPEQWKKLDSELDELLKLDTPEQQARLNELSKVSPEFASSLANLLQQITDEEKLNSYLNAAFRFIREKDDLDTGTNVGPWRLIRRIGQGGMAEVFLAERADGAFKKQVALKLLWQGLVGKNTENLVRQERQILADLDDHRIANLIDGGITPEGRPWLAMEFVEGEPITDFSRTNKLNLEARIRLMIDVAKATTSAHRQLVVHGDIKPNHVLVTTEGQIKLLDFGISRLMEQPKIGGANNIEHWKALTPAVASPEQLTGHAPTPASDVYQLGLILQDLIGDVMPARGRRQRELQAIVERSLEHDPKQRYSGADRLAEDLLAFLAYRPANAMPDTLTYRGLCFLRRHWRALSFSTVLLSIGAVALVNQINQARLLEERNTTNEAVMYYLEAMLESNDPQAGYAIPVGDPNVLDTAAAQLDQRLADQPKAKIRVLNTLGRIHRSRNELLISKRRYTAALELAREYGLDDEREEALEGLTIAGAWVGSYAEFEAYLRELLNLRLAMGSSKEVLDRTRLGLADLLHSRGNYPEALALATQTEERSSDPAWTAQILGMIQRDLGLFGTAEQSLLTSFVLETENRPLRPTRIAIIADNRALLALQQGELDAARDALNESLRTRQGYFGDRWEGLLWNRHWDALFAMVEGDAERAADLLDIMLEDYVEFLGESSHLLAFGRSDRAWTALALSDLDLARTLFAQAGERLASIWEQSHPRLAEVRLGQAVLAIAEHKPAVAQSYAEQALAIRHTLPSDSEGARIWRDHTCRIVLASGGECDEATDGKHSGLDAARMDNAIKGLCRSHISTTPSHPLCNGSLFRSQAK